MILLQRSRDVVHRFTQGFRFFMELRRTAAYREMTAGYRSWRVNYRAIASVTPEEIAEFHALVEKYGMQHLSNRDPVTFLKRFP